MSNQFIERRSIKINNRSRKVNIYNCEFCNKQIYFTPIIHKRIDGYERMDLDGNIHIC